MKAIHQYKNFRIKKEVAEDLGLAIGNDLGNYLYLANKEETRYQGFFCADGENYRNELLVYKIIDSVDILGESKFVEAENNFFKIGRKRENGLKEEYFLPAGHNSLCLKINRRAKAEIILDIRHPYDSRQMGRFYDIQIKDNYALVKFIKRRDWQEDGMGDKKEFALYLAVKTDRDEYQKIGEFFSKYYSKDHKRNSYPWDRFVYRALKIEFEKAVFSAAKNPDKAIEEVKLVFDSFEKLCKKEKEGVYKKFKVPNVMDEEIKMAHLCAQNSVYTLLVENGNKKGAYAGLPWFFQFWTRDEAVALLEIFKLNKKLALEIVLSQLESVLENGQVPNRRFPKSMNGNVESADALGWLCDRISKMMKKSKLPGGFLMDAEEKIEKAAIRLIKNRTKNELAINLGNETWMDSVARAGARIEIQAGRLKLYNLLYALTKNDQYRILEEELKSRVKKEFYANGFLKDSSVDSTIRPNIFLAAYLYPNLLSEKEWESCFDAALEKLYLAWGGISTVDKTGKEFAARDSGENSPSYHNGNSWYWVNNLVALVLYRTNSHKYSSFINGIMEASTNEILYKGVIGHHSEMSEAESQTSSGCNFQLWSAAMYLEVFDEMLNLKNNLFSRNANPQN